MQDVIADRASAVIPLRMQGVEAQSIASLCTADHITSGRCPIYRPPEGIDGLIDLDDETRAWLENNALDMCAITHKKKKQYAIKCCASAHNEACMLPFMRKCNAQT